MLSPLFSHDISELPGVTHGFYTRAGGVSEGPAFASLNCSLSQDDKDRVRENRRRVGAHLGANRDALYIPSLCHSARATFVSWATAGDAPPAADGVVTTARGLAIGALAADCAPVLFADVEAGVVGAVHAGWRGALAGVVDATVDLMVKNGARVDRIRAAVGPCIRQPNYEVGPEFVKQFLQADPANARFFVVPYPGAREHFDLARYVGHRLERIGLKDPEDVGVCTFADERMFSYRRNNKAGIKGFGCQVSAVMLH